MHSLFYGHTVIQKELGGNACRQRVTHGKRMMDPMGVGFALGCDVKIRPVRVRFLEVRITRVCEVGMASAATVVRQGFFAGSGRVRCVYHNRRVMSRQDQVYPTTLSYSCSKDRCCNDLFRARGINHG